MNVVNTPRSNRQPRAPPRSSLYEQILRLVTGIAMGLAEHPETTAMLMVLMKEASTYPQDNGETIANLLLSHLFMWTSGEHDEAETRYVTEKCASFISMIEGGTQ